MTQVAIQQQIDATKEVTAKAIKSKEYANKLLDNVGIEADQKEEKKKEKK